MSEKKCILFVDDDHNVLDGLRRMLYGMRQEWEMEFVTQGVLALEVMNEKHFDIIVSDFRMPHMNGVDLLEEVREAYPGTIRFMFTSYTDQLLNGRASRYVHQFISKPCDAQQLKGLITRAFALHGRLRSKEVIAVLSKLRSLPVMPTVYHEVINALNNPQSSSRKIGKMIAHDIGMSAKTLQVANASLNGPSNRIVDPVHAVTYLGLKTVEALVLNHGVFSRMSERKIREFFVTGLQEHCIRVGMLSRAICKSENMGDDELEIATMGGILHDAGKMILISQFPDEFAKAIQTSRKDQVPLCDVERDLFNVTHAELGGCLLELWGLPNPIIEAVTFHHEPWNCIDDRFSVATAVYVANTIDHQLCCALGDGWCEKISMDYIEQLGITDQLKQWRRIHLPIEAKEYEHVR